MDVDSCNQPNGIQKEEEFDQLFSDIPDDFSDFEDEVDDPNIFKIRGALPAYKEYKLTLLEVHREFFLSSQTACLTPQRNGSLQCNRLESTLSERSSALCPVFIVLKPA